MGRIRKARRRSDQAHPSGGSARRSNGATGGLRAHKEAARSGGRGARSGKRPVLRFVLILATATIAFNVLFYLWISKGSFFNAYLGLNAELCAIMLRILGDDAVAAGTRLFSSRFGLDIHLGCDGLQSSAFFACAVLASPLRTSLRARILPILLGTLGLLTLNLVRIVSLYYTGVFFPSAFEVMHVEVWQAVFIFLPIGLWLVWVKREKNREALARHGID